MASDIRVVRQPTLSTQQLDALREAAFEIASRAVADLQASDLPRWTNTLANSIVAVRTATGAKVLVRANYARWVHDGRKPGRLPNLDNLRDWAEDHGILGERRLRAVAFAIKKRGIKPQPFLRDYANSDDFKLMAQRVVRRRLPNALA